MNKDDKFCCCEKCFEFLARRSVSVAKLWVEICGEHYRKGMLIVRLDLESNTLEYLEKLSYITTHETDKYLFIKPNGLQWDYEEEEYFFCLDLLAHNY